MNKTDGEDRRNYDQLNRNGKRVPLLYHPECPSVAELIPAWAEGLADGSTSAYYELRDKLWYHLEKYVINSRLGVRVIGPGGQPQCLEGRHLSGLFRMMGEDILVSKEAVLDFAHRHKLLPPSWWSDVTQRKTQPSRSPGKLKRASDAMINEVIRSVYDAAKAAGTKPPNIKQLPAAVLPLLEQQGVTTSKRRIQQLGEAEEFKRLRWPPGRTVAASERRKK